MNTLEHKGYIGVFSYDPEADIFHGDVINMRDTVTFQGRSIDELKTALQESVEDYLAFCKEDGVEAQKPDSDRFNLRMSPGLHQKVAKYAALEGVSLNTWITRTLEKHV